MIYRTHVFLLTSLLTNYKDAIIEKLQLIQQTLLTNSHPEQFIKSHTNVKNCEQKLNDVPKKLVDLNVRFKGDTHQEIQRTNTAAKIAKTDFPVK